MSAPETIRVHREGPITTIELHRPDSLNAWNERLGVELLDAVEQAASEDAARVVCLTGAGRAFSSGADLSDLDGVGTTASGRPDLGSVLRDRYNPIIAAVRRMEKPVVAAVNGPAAGIGLSLALAADLVVARRSAYFLLAFVNIGLTPDGGASFSVPERVGLTRALEMALLGERVGAEQAERWGLINACWDDEQFDEQLAALLARLGAGATRAYGGVKRQLNAWALSALEQQLELEAEVQAEMAETEDFLTGTTAFLRKQAPAFEGR